MVQDWVTIILLIFGIVVGVIGVIAYLRLFRKERLAAALESRSEASPPDAESALPETGVSSEKTVSNQNTFKE